MCLGAETDYKRKGSRVVLNDCGITTDVNNQHWYETNLHELKLGNFLCLDAYKGVRLMKCDEQGAFQQWKRTGKVCLFHIVHT